MCYNAPVRKFIIYQLNSLPDFKLEQNIGCSSTLFLTSTRSLKHQLEENLNLKVIDYTELHSIIKTKTKDAKSLTDNEMRYLLFNTIQSMTDNEKTQQAYKNSINLIYELFSNLLFNGIEKNDFNFKKKNIIPSQKEIFQLYINYIDLLNTQSKKSYQSCFSECLKEYLKQYKEVYLCGFTFFNDIQMLLFKLLMELNINVTFVVDSEFITNDFILPLLKEFSVESEIVYKDDKCETKFIDLKNNLFNCQKVNNEISNSIKFYKPFFTREMEFQFIINDIKQRLQHCKTKSEIEQECKNIAIVITNNFSKQAELFNDLLKRQGVFISPNEQIFYSQEEYFDSDCFSNLTKEQRVDEFYNFTRLEVYQPPKTLFNSSLGRFISEIYKIAGYGMQLEDFNTLLQINWLFKNTQIETIIGEFNIIKCFFEELENISDWKKQINHLIWLKQSIDFSGELRNHPLKSIEIESLIFINKYITFIDNVISKINKVNGSIKQHIKTLIEIIKIESNDENVENELLIEFSNLLNSEDGVDIDNDYFAKNFQTLITEYLSSKKEQSKNIRLNLINLESANTYNIVYVPMFEENKYPLAFKYDFPFTREIVDLLQDKNFITNYHLPINKTQAYNLKLSNYVFKNLFNIAKEEIIFTRVESENGNTIDMSIFGYDIKTKLNNEELSLPQTINSYNQDFNHKIIFKDIKLKDMYLNDMLGYFVCPKMFYYNNQFDRKSCYKDKFLLNLYCKALIVNKTFALLVANKIYTPKTFKQEVEKAFEKATNEIFNLLPIFNDNNKNDILLTAKRQVDSFVEDKILSGKFKPKAEFSLSLSNEKVVNYKDIKVKTYKNLILFDITRKKSCEFDISKSLDLLISSTSGNATEEEHFWDIINEMEADKKGLDYANSLNYLAFKLNTQLNSEKYNKDGVERVKEVVAELEDRDCSNLAFNKSPYCSFCKFKDICMGGVDNG